LGREEGSSSVCYSDRSLGYGQGCPVMWMANDELMARIKGE
jgi:hypothetical protein